MGSGCQTLHPIVGYIYWGDSRGEHHACLVRARPSEGRTPVALKAERYNADIAGVQPTRRSTGHGLTFASMIIFVLSCGERSSAPLVLNAEPSIERICEATASERPLTQAVDGPGYFVLHRGPENTCYTKAGEFRVEDEYLVAPWGHRVQGFAEPRVTDSDPAADLFVPDVLPSVAVSQLTLLVHFDGRVASPLTPFDRRDPIRTSVMSQDTALYDGVHPTHFRVTILFARDHEHEWTWHMAHYRSPQDMIVVADGRLTFYESGELRDQDAWSYLVEIPGAAPLPMTIDFSGSTNHPRSTEADIWNNSSVEWLQTDGRPAGSRIPGAETVYTDGTLVVQYANDRQLRVGRIALADFDDPAELFEVQPGLFDATGHQAWLGRPGEVGYGRIRPNAPRDPVAYEPEGEQEERHGRPSARMFGRRATETAALVRITAADLA